MAWCGLEPLVALLVSEKNRGKETGQRVSAMFEALIH